MLTFGAIIMLWIAAGGVRLVVDGIVGSGTPIALAYIAAKGVAAICATALLIAAYAPEFVR